ncbi:TPA: LPXTG cell wall anchor domain-containing protein, partial [Vibrio cholerae]|nr:LPXTG cell wall anchor domain-containing protein [Vibrio cholerae]
MKLKEQISQILLTKLNSIINPKFHNKFILLLLTAGLGLLTPSILSVLVKFQLITDGFAINIEAGEATNSTLALIGLALVSMSVYLLRLVRKQEHEVFMYEESLDHDFSVNYYICEDFDHLK